VFADHSLASDQVFAELHLVSCRNVLIYFEKSLQDRAIGLFRDSLVRSGFLGLGAQETIRVLAHAASFADFVPHERIYRKAPTALDARGDVQ
jgi:chemotaxis protein methyltransferase CheR